MAKQTGVRFGIVIDYLQQARTDPQLAGATTVDILDRETRVIASRTHTQLNVPRHRPHVACLSRGTRAGRNTIPYGTDLMLTLRSAAPMECPMTYAHGHVHLLEEPQRAGCPLPMR